MNRDEIDLTALLLMRCVMRHKIRFLLAFAATFGTIMLGMLTLTPNYEVSTVLIGGQSDLDPATNAATRRPSDSGVSLAGIAESEEVLRAAVEQIGLSKLLDPAVLDNRSIFEKARAHLLHVRKTLEGGDLSKLSLETLLKLEDEKEPAGSVSATPRPNVALAILGRSVKVKAEPNSDIIRISVRHKDPAVAAAFANALSEAFIRRQAAIFSRPGALDFFREQRAAFAKEFETVSDEFRDFMVASGVYSVDEQRQLLLRRRDDLTLALATTSGTIADKLAQKSAIVTQLRKLAPVARSQYVSSVVNSLGEDRNARNGSDIRTLADNPNVNGESPLLLVKVYQDSMSVLFRVDAELAGLEKIREAQNADVEAVTRDLSRLAANEYRYFTLKRAVSIAGDNMEMYEKRMTDEKINAESRAANLLSVKIVQAATPPSDPSFPNYPLVTAMAGIVAMLVGFAVSGAVGLRRLREDALHNLRST